MTRVATMSSGGASVSGRSGPSRDRADGRSEHAGSTIALRGDVLMDGRRMGRIVAAGQASTANLPQGSASAVNLRAVPLFAGTSVPL